MNHTTTSARLITLRFLLSVSIGASYALLTIIIHSIRSDPGDLWQALAPASDFVNGVTPLNRVTYASYVPSPLTIIPLGIPFLFMPQVVAVGLFIGVSYTWLAWSIQQHQPRWRLWLFLGPSVYACAAWVQYSPLLLALSLSQLAPLGLLIKPHTALPLVMVYRARRVAWIIVFVIAGISLLVYPLWPITWLNQIKAYTGIIPILLPLGFGLLLALLRWHNPVARLIFFTALLPSRALYDLTALYMVPQSKRILLLMLIADWIIFIAPLAEPTRILLSLYVALAALFSR